MKIMNNNNVATEEIIPQFTELNELCSQNSGGKVVFATDDFFAVAENMIDDSEPVFIGDKYTEHGKWMDGWETRRKRITGHDWCIIKLSTRGLIYGLDVDTAFFTGNYAPKYSIQAARLTPGEEELFPKRDSEMGKACSSEELEIISKFNTDTWQEIVPTTNLRPGYPDSRHNYQKVLADEPWTHIRVNMYPDGGIARLRVYGLAQPDILTFENQLVDLISMMNGGCCQGYSNAHFGHPRNMIKPGRGVNMGDGWETARRLDRPGVLSANSDGTLQVPGSEWAIFRLGCAGKVEAICADTCHFKGNFPDSIRIEGTTMGHGDWHPALDCEWFDILAPTKLTANAEHWFESMSHEKLTHVRITMAPDGGISRVRLLGEALTNRNRS